MSLCTGSLLVIFFFLPRILLLMVMCVSTSMLVKETKAVLNLMSVAVMGWRPALNSQPVSLCGHYLMKFLQTLLELILEPTSLRLNIDT